MILRALILAVAVTAFSPPRAAWGAYVRIPDSEDNYIRDYSPYDTYNYGATADLECGSDKVGGKMHKSRILVRFPAVADSLPVGATIDSAKLFMDCTVNAQQDTARMYHVLQNWDEGAQNGAAGTASWNQWTAGTGWGAIGCNLAVPDGDPVHADSTWDRVYTEEDALYIGATGFYGWHIGSSVQDWADGSYLSFGLPNYGVMLKMDDEATDARMNEFSASDQGDATVPYLDIWYSVVPPVVTGLDDAATAYADQYDSTYARFGFEVDDSNDDTVRVHLELERIGQGFISWDSLNGYAAGDTGWIDTSAAADDTIRIDFRAMWGAGVETVCVARVIATDIRTNADTVLSDTFNVDTRDPSGLTALTASDSSGGSATLGWSVVTEGNFDHYEIRYATSAGVNLATPDVWDDGDDGTLATRTTNSTTVTGLSAGQDYYFKIWAYDAHGNYETVAERSVTLLAAPVVGWDPSGCVLALAPAAWSRGNGTADQTSGEFPGYPDGSYDATLTNMTVGYGYVYNGGGYLNFDGSDDYIDTELKTAFANGSQHTFEFKIRYDDIGGIQKIYTEYTDGSNRMDIQILDDALDFLFVVGGDARRATSTEVLADGGLYHLHFVKDGGSLKMYINGSEVTYATQQTYDLGGFTAADGGLLGTRADFSSYFSGRLYWTAVYNTVLSPGRIGANAIADSTMFCVATSAGDAVSVAKMLDARQYDQNFVRVLYNATDVDDATVTVTAGGKYADAGSWTAWDGGFKNFAEWDTGAVSTTPIGLDSIRWRMKSMLGADQDTTYLLRVIATAPDGAADTGYTDTFKIDTKNPAGLATFAAIGSTETACSLAWDASGLVETNFHHYEIWYGTVLADVNGRSGGALEWDNGDDMDLGSAAEESTIVTGLNVGTKYYFRIWAVDSFSNVQALPADSMSTKTSPVPVLKGWDGAGALYTDQFDTSRIYIGYQVEDSDDATVVVTAELKEPDAAGWADWDSLNGYSSGDSGTVTVGAGINDTIVLDLRAMWGNQVDTTVVIRVIADDLDVATANDTLYADTIVVDTKDPVGLGASGLSVTAADTYSVTLGWSAVTDEGNFDHYEIWYDTLPGITRGAGEQEWDDGDDGNLATMATTSTEITGLLKKRHYYFKVWAVDSLGNDSTVAETDTSTINVMPAVTGWSGAANVGAVQTDTNTVRIRYEMYDFDDAQCTVRVELKRVDEGGWTAWSGLRAYASGDTGVLDTSGTAGRTAYLDIRALLGASQDTLALVRVIAFDTVGADTAVSDTFVLDTRDPQGMANFVLKDSTLTTVKAVWDSVTLEKNFGHYEIWLSSSKSEVLNRNGAAQEWDNADDDTLAYRGGDSTMVTGLTYNTLYYFQLWAYDSLGNYAKLGIDSLLTPTTAQASLTNTQTAGIRSDGGSALPEESSWNYGASTTFSTGLANAGVNDPVFRGLVRTADLALMPQGATLDSAKLNVYCSSYSGTPDNLRVYRVIQNWIEGSADGAEQVGSVTWDSYGGGASWYTIGCDSTVANAAATDGGEADRTVTPEDTQPVNAAAWITFDVSTAFQAWVDGYYGLGFGWDNNGVVIKQDDEVSVASNTFASDDDGTNPPYFDVWYRVVPPALSGWDDAVYADVEQYDTSSIRVGFEMLDENDGSTYVSIELHKLGGAWSAWDTVMDFASGDTGWVDTSATWNDTAFIDIRGLLGDVDSLYELRVIARDKRMNTDTLYSEVFDLDTKDPAGLGTVSASDSSETYITIDWSAVTESNFEQYKVYYDTVAGITETDTVWDQTDDAALGNKATTTTTITGLIPNRKYYFKVWAYDTLGNEASAGPESCYTLVGPVLSGFDDAVFISAAQYDSSMVRIGFEVDDDNDDTVHVRAEYKKSTAGSWTALVNVTGDTGWVDTSVTANDTMLWDARAQLGTVDTFYLVRVIARDKDSLYDTLATDTFYIDTQDPQNLVNFRPVAMDTFAVTLDWTPPAESRFDYYEIRYDSVPGITRTDSLWGIDDQPSLGLLATSTATVSGLERRTTYYFKMWAYDSLGNVTATQETLAATANVPPQVTGWADAGSVYAVQYDTGTIRVGYEFDDYDDAAGTLHVEMKMKGGGWLDWDSLDAFCSGDTGVVGTSTVANDTVLIDIRGMWGALIDTTCLVRVIARDPQGGADTMTSDTFVVDTRDPAGLSKVYPFTSDTFNVSVRWDTVTFDRNFDKYFLYYSAGSGVDRTDSLWGTGSDAALGTAGTETTTVTGLAGKKRYYFRLYAEDSLGNVASSAETSYATANIAPDISGFGAGTEAFALQYGEFNVRLGYEVRDYDDSQVRVYLEGKKPADGSWTPWSTLRSFVYGDTGYVATSPAANDTVVWKMKTQYGPGIDTFYVMRIIGIDTAGASDTVQTDTFSIDTRKPFGMDNLSVSDSTEVSATVVWDSVTVESHFDHYELWTGTSLSDVQGRSGGAVEWDDGDDADLAFAGTETTIVTGLTIDTKYYVMIWAFDQFGNDTTVNADSFTTLTSNVPVVRGWNGAVAVDGAMSDSSTVRIGYQVDDSDDGSVIVKYELKRPAEAGWISFDSLNTYTVAGSDTGAVPTSATANDTVWLDVRTLWGGQVDTVYVARVIARDDALPTNNADTTLTDEFVVDTKDPVWAGAKLEPIGNDTFSVSLQWTGTPTETNFGHYEIWYDTLAGITRAGGESEWDHGDDANLANKATTTTTVTGLNAKKTYYFKVWAQDSLGNETALNDTFYTTADIAPEVTGWDDAAAAYAEQADSSVIRVGYEVDDYDDPSGTVRVEMKMAGGPWMDWDSLNAYATGDTGVVAVSATANDTVLLDGRTVWGAALDTLFLARVIVKDTSGKADTALADTFVVDTKDPVWSAAFEPTGADTFSVSLQWTGTPAETNFGHYEIWYDTLAGITRTAGETEWDHGDDAALANKATTTTTVTGLKAKKTYHFRVWAQDSLGNETALNDTFYATVDVPPVVTGWADAATANARQYDSSRVRLGYEVDDYDDDSSTVTLQVRMTGGPWMDWDSLNAYATGDTGTVAGSPTANDTVILNARTVWGPVLDTAMTARFIAVDTSGLSDTVASNAFVVDTKDPSWGGGALSVVDSSGDRVTIAWDTVAAENNFLKYVIWYDTSKANVMGRTGTADKYDPASNAAMSQRGTDTVIITGLLDDEQYYFKIWAFDSLGNFASLPPESATTTTPSKRLNDIADAFIQDTVGFGGEEYFNNYGAATYLRVGWRDAVGAGANPKYRSLIKFTDVGDIPTGATVDSAYLRLQCNQSRTNDTVRVYRVLQDWNAGTANNAYQANAVSWDSTGSGDAWNGIGLGAAVANGSAAEDGVHDRTVTEEDKAYVNGTGAYSWDITNAVSNWIGGTWSNYGLFIKQDTESGVDSAFNDFISGDGVGNTPYVDIYYRILAPELSGWGTDTMHTRQYDSSYARIGYRLADEEDSNAYVSMQVRKKDGGWTAWSSVKTRVSGDTGWVDTSSTANDTVLLNVRSLYGTAVETTCQARLIAQDIKGNVDTLLSLNFVADTKDPAGLGGFSSTGATENSVSFSWNVVTEKNFGTYRIHYDTVASVTQSDSAWDNVDDGNLEVRTTTTTTVSGLVNNKRYYFKLWALDSLGNRSTVAEIDRWTLSRPVLSGWGGADTVDAVQADSSLVRIGYELHDVDDESVRIVGQYKLAGAALWATLANVTGDTGWTDTSSTDNDTIVWNARAQLGVVDTFCLVRLIATDDTGLKDTLRSDTFYIDTKDPLGLANFRPTASDTFSVTFQWTPPTETRFSCYGIRYATSAGISVDDTLWDCDDDAALNTLGTATTTVAGLLGKTRYYFRMWAADSVGNVAATQETSYVTANVAPDLTGWGGGAYLGAVQYNTDSVRVGFEAGDYDDDSVTVTLEGKKPAAAGWTAWTSLNGNMYGDTGRVLSSVTANDTAIWDMRSAFGAGIDTYYVFRALAADTAGGTDTLYSDTFAVDTKAPVGLDTLGGIDSTSVQVTLRWDTVTVENNFGHYEVWYDTLLANVTGRTGTALEWDNGDDANLAVRGTDTTIITNLTMNTKYYFKIWAVDQFGNESTAVAAAESVTTLPSLVPVLEGWSGAARISAYQLDSSVVRFGYQVDDFNDAQVDVTMELKKVGGAWTNWAGLKAYASGDTGTVNVSASANDTVELDVRALLGGSVDTLYVARFIAADGGNADTLVTDTFSIDTKDPAGGLTAVAPGDADTNTVTVTWDKITDEPHFWHYEVRYDTVASVTLSDAAWDTSDDTNLRYADTTSTVITGLLSKHRYYFRVWAVDSLGNRYGSNEDDTTTLNAAPVVTGWGGAAQVPAVQQDSSLVRIGFELTDEDDSADTARFGIKLVGDGWISWDSLDGYASGDTGAIPVAAADDTAYFDVRAAWGDAYDTLAIVRVIVRDSAGLADTAVSDTFVVDTKDPVGLANFAVTGTLATSITVGWDTVTSEGHFDHYEIWIDTVKADAAARGGDAVEWDSDNDADLDSAGTGITTITGLTAATKYFIRMWAVDGYGNEAALPLDSVTTITTNYTPLTDAVDAAVQTTVGFGGEEDSMNFGGSANLRVGWRDAVGFGDNPVYRTLIKFGDVDTIPANTIVDSAKFYMYCTQNTADDTVRLYRVLKNWAEGSASGSKQNGAVCWQDAQFRTTAWNTAGVGATVANAGALEDNVYDRTVDAEAKAYVSATGWVEWDLTDAVQKWVDGGWTNYGVLVKQDTESGADSVFNDFSSAEAPTNRPYVKVWYSSESENLAGWWTEGGRWEKRIDINFNNAFLTSSIAEFPVLVKLHDGRIDYGDFKGDGSDLRFLDADGGTELSYHIETWDPAGTSYVWVNVPAISSNGSPDSIWMYYGNPDADDVQDTTGTWDNGYQGVWHLNDDFKDYSGSGNDGTNYGSTDTVGVFSDGQWFDNSNDGIDAGDIETGGFTDLAVSAWFRTSNAISTQRLLSKDQQGVPGNFLIQFNGGAWSFSVYDSSSGSWSSAVYASVAPNDGQWHLAEGVVDNAGDRIRFYIDAVEVANAAFNAAALDDSDNEEFTIGADSDVGAFGLVFDGIIDEVRLSDIVRSAAWIEAEYRAGIDSLLHWADCVRDSHDNTAPDNDMTLTASYLPGTDGIALAWNPAAIDTVTADSVGIWYRYDAYPSGAFDAAATLVGMHSKTVTADTLAGAITGSTYHFCVIPRTNGAVWGDTAGSACDTASVPPDTLAPDNDVALAAAAGTNKSVALSWTPGGIDSADAESMAVWYKVGDYPDSAYDATATLLAKYGDLTTAADTLHYAVPGSTYYFMLFVRDTSGNWSDSSVSGGASAVPVDTLAPDNDVTLTASAVSHAAVVFSWNPAAVDSTDADSVGIWFKTGDYPDSAHDATASQALVLPVAAALGTLNTGLTHSTTYYFSFAVRDTSGNWSDTALAACDTARTQPTASWWNAAWHCRQELSLRNQASDSSLHDFPVLVKLHDGRIDYGLVRDDGADLRFIDADDATPLDFEIESWDESGTSYVWVEIPKVDSQSNADSIWLYYNNPAAADGQDTSGTWNAGYAGVWHFGESGSGSRMDATSNSNDGTPAGYDGNEKVAGRTGQGDYLDGGDDYISFSDVPFDFTDNFSVSAWMQTGDTGNDWARMIDKLNRWDTGWGLGGKSGAGYGFTAYWSGGWGGDPAASFGAVSDGSWHHVTAVVEGGVVRTYTDGVLGATYAARAGQSITTNNNAMLFGKSSNTAAYWTGSLDEVRISSVVRDSNWIYAQHASMIDTFIDWASAAPVLDEYAPPDNDMTLTATALTESSVVLSWDPSSIDSADAYRVGIWYKTTDYPDSANDVTATLLGYYPLDTAADTVTSGLSSGTSYYFTVTVQDSSGNWAAVTDAGSDMTTTPFKAWWDLDWLNRQQLTFRNQAAAEDLADMPVMVKLYHPRIDTAKTADDGSDLRFVAANNITPLDYEIETWNEAGTSYVWVEVPSVAAGSNADYIWMYYNNDGAVDAQDTAGTWNTGYASVFHLNASVTDEGSADSAWRDATANGNHASQRGTDDAGARMAAGSQYDGTDDFDSTSQDLNQWLGQGAQATLSAWVKTSQAGNASTWLAPGITGIEENGGSDDIFWGWIDAAGLIGITAGNGTSVKSTSVINDGAWHHVAFTRVAASGAVEVYVDGIREGNGNSDTGTKSNAFYSLGRIEDTGGTPVYFNGTLDEVRISSTRRSGDWIYAQHASMIDTFIDWGAAVEDEADTLPPDNDGALTAVALAGDTRRIALSWQPGNIDSVDAYAAGIWYFSGGADGYPDSAYDPGAILVGIYAMSDSADTVTIPGGAADDTVHFTLLFRDTTGNWSDTFVVACDTAVVPDILAPDNDVTLTASALTSTSVAFSWNPVLIDSADADSVGIWVKTGDFPDSAYDVSATQACLFPVDAGAGTLSTGLHPGSVYYFSLTVRDSSGNWADTALAACDTALTMPGTLFVSGAAMSPGPVSPGDADVDMLMIKFYAEHETVYVDTVILHVENTADTFDLDTVALFADNGGLADTMIPGAFAFAGSLGSEIVVMIMPSESLVVPQGETLRVHLVADIKAGADAAHIANFTINSGDSLRVRGKYSGRSEAVSGTFPVQSGDVSLPVELSSFTALQSGGSVLLAWRTASETDNLGYHVYRSRWREGPYQRLNADLIRGAVNSETGNGYAFTDSTLRSPGTYWYKLSDVDIASVQTYHGPVAVAFVPPGAGVLAVERRLELIGNPLSAGSVLRFRTAARGVMRIVIYNDGGHRIGELRYDQAGSGELLTVTGGRLMDMLNRRGGIYFIELHTQDAVERIRVLYLR